MKILFAMGNGTWIPSVLAHGRARQQLVSFHYLTQKGFESIEQLATNDYSAHPLPIGRTRPTKGTSNGNGKSKTSGGG